MFTQKNGRKTSSTYRDLCQNCGVLIEWTKAGEERRGVRSVASGTVSDSCNLVCLCRVGGRIDNFSGHESMEKEPVFQHSVLVFLSVAASWGRTNIVIF